MTGIARQLGAPFDFAQDMLCAFAGDCPNPILRINPTKYVKAGDLFPLQKLLLIHPNDAAKAQMASRSIDGLGMRAAGR